MKLFGNAELPKILKSGTGSSSGGFASGDTSAWLATVQKARGPATGAVAQTWSLNPALTPGAGALLVIVGCRYATRPREHVPAEGYNDQEAIRHGLALLGVFQRVAGGWVGSVEELPGANTQGSTLEETRENLKVAIRLVLEANRELAQRETQGRDVVRESIVVSL